MNNIVLKAGSHINREHGMCAMEWVAFLAGEEHTDRPECVHLNIGDVAREWNDRCTHEERQEYIAPLLWTFMGTNNPESRDLVARKYDQKCQELAVKAARDYGMEIIGDFVSYDELISAARNQKGWQLNTVARCYIFRDLVGLVFCAYESHKEDQAMQAFVELYAEKNYGRVS